MSLGIQLYDPNTCQEPCFHIQVDNRYKNNSNTSFAIEKSMIFLDVLLFNDGIYNQEQN